MNEKPILFSDPMVRAIMENRKTVTRRVAMVPWLIQHNIKMDTEEGRQKALRLCRYGRVGDQLWVKECHSLDHPKYPILFRSDGYDPRQEYDREFRFKWKPSIFMRRCHSRIQLEIVDVSVSRIQEMTEEEALLEGFEAIQKSNDYLPSALTAFRALWDKLNNTETRRYSWKNNPWVFRVEFKPLNLGGHIIPETPPN